MLILQLSGYAGWSAPYSQQVTINESAEHFCRQLLSTLLWIFSPILNLPSGSYSYDLSLFLTPSDHKIQKTGHYSFLLYSVNRAAMLYVVLYYHDSKRNIDLLQINDHIVYLFQCFLLSCTFSLLMWTEIALNFLNVNSMDIFVNNIKDEWICEKSRLCGRSIGLHTHTQYSILLGPNRWMSPSSEVKHFNSLPGLVSSKSSHNSFKCRSHIACMLRSTPLHHCFPSCMHSDITTV